MPGMQKPHCAACSSMKARCTAPGRAAVPRPSSVVILRPPSAATGVTHEKIASPSASTVQAPHWPRPQPYLAPLRCSSSRST